MDMMQFMITFVFGWFWGLMFSAAAFWALIKIVENERYKNERRNIHKEKGGNNQ